ncbi:MAG: hypothetical protein ACK5Q5_21105 [Planctomycetaceae bacterium]
MFAAASRNWWASLVVLCWELVGGLAFGQQRFSLTVSNDPLLASVAVLGERDLQITDSQGQTFRYQRETQFDTPDGQYLGFYSAAARQPLRWPVTGQGTMLIGDPTGQAWRASAQQIQPAGGGGGMPVIRPRPGPVSPPTHPSEAGTPPVFGPTAGQPPPGANATAASLFGLLRPNGLAGGYQGAPMHIGVGADLRGRPRMAMIDQDGSVQVYDGTDDGWRFAHELAARGLAPGAPLGLTPDVVPGRIRVIAVTTSGVLTMLAQDQGPLSVASNILFPPAASISTSIQDIHRRAYAVDAVGRMWELDLSFGGGGQRHQVVESQPGLLVPGSPVQVLSTLDPASGRVIQTLFVTDSRGTILQYQSMLGGWTPRMEVAIGFVPGAPVGATLLDLPNRVRLLYLAAVDWQGRLQLLSGDPSNLQSTIIDAGQLPPGAPVALQSTLEGPLISAVGMDGQWRTWRPGTAGAWSGDRLFGGFPPAAPVIVDPLTGGLIAADVRGRVVPAAWQNGSWTCSLCDPTIPLPPRLVSRQVIPNPALPPARVTLINSGDEELVVQVGDAAAPANSIELRIPMRGTVQHIFERDAGGTVDEVYQIPGLIGGWTEQSNRYPLPPQPRYSLAVWANRTTYQYVNKNPNKPKGALPDFDLKSHVSLGVFDLPPGELLHDGETLDVHRAATLNGNPGAAGYFNLPSGGPTLVPKP